MRNYDIPLMLTADSVDKDRILAARRIIDAMPEEELRAPAPVNRQTVISYLKSHEIAVPLPYSYSDEVTLVSDILSDLLELDSNERIANLNVADSETPRNYDVALAWATAERMEKARRLMDFLIETGQLTDPLRKGAFEEFEELEARELEELLGEGESSVECRYCGEVYEPASLLSDHIGTQHKEQTNWVGTREVHVGIFKTLTEFYGVQGEVKSRLSLGSQRSNPAWEDFVPWPRRFLSEYGLPNQGRTKGDLQGTVGIGATSGFKRADVVFLNLDAERAVVVEHSSKMTEEAFEQVQTYAALLQDDYPFLERPRTVVNFHSRDLLMEPKKKQYSVSVDGVRNSYSVDQPIHIINSPRDFSVFDLPVELQEYLNVAQHLQYHK